MQIFWFYTFIMLTYGCIITAFVLLMIGSARVERQNRRRQECMMNHPAGSRARTEP